VGDSSEKGLADRARFYRYVYSFIKIVLIGPEKP
jgi:hypothetical protein